MNNQNNEQYVECEEMIFQSKGTLLRRAIEALFPHIVMFHQIFNEIAHIDCYCERMDVFLGIVLNLTSI